MVKFDIITNDTKSRQVTLQYKRSDGGGFRIAYLGTPPTVMSRVIDGIEYLIEIEENKCG